MCRLFCNNVLCIFAVLFCYYIDTLTHNKIEVTINLWRKLNLFITLTFCKLPAFEADILYVSDFLLKGFRDALYYISEFLLLSAIVFLCGKISATPIFFWIFLGNFSLMFVFFFFLINNWVLCYCVFHLEDMKDQ
jgi:hypothetical protein